MGDLLNQADVGLWFNRVKREDRSLFPALPDDSRYYRMLTKLERLWADLTLALTAHHPPLAYSVDAKPSPVCWFERHRRPRAMTEATVGFSTQGPVYGFKLHALTTLDGQMSSLPSRPPMKPTSPSPEPCLTMLNAA